VTKFPDYVAPFTCEEEKDLDGGHYNLSLNKITELTELNDDSTEEIHQPMIRIDKSRLRKRYQVSDELLNVSVKLPRPHTSTPIITSCLLSPSSCIPSPPTPPSSPPPQHDSYILTRKRKSNADEYLRKTTPRPFDNCLECKAFLLTPNILLL
jgi:hypothetical protein